MFNLFELLKAIEVTESRNEKDVHIEGIEYNSKNVKEGYLFVCIKGYKTDGHRYIPQAIANGAAALIVEDFQEDCSLPQFKVKNSRHALAALGDRYYNHPSKDMKIIGITATNGKTTTAFMTNSILERHGLKTGIIGTVMVKFGKTADAATLTTPQSLDLQRYFAEMRDEKISHVTMEVSSIALELNRVDCVDYDIVSLHNISRDHIDLHGSFEEYFNSKASLIRNAKPSQWAILNLDDSYSASLINETKARVITFGLENHTGHLACKNLDLSTGRARFTVEIRKPFEACGIEYKPTEFNIELSVPGYHSVHNSMVAITIGLLCGVPIETIQESLKNFVGVERRFEFIYEKDFKIVDDHFANVGNINVTLGTLNFMKFNKLRIVYAVRGGRGPVVNRENAETVVKWASKLGITEIIATLSKSHVTEKDVVTEDELNAFLEVMSKAGIKVDLYDELPDAIGHALTQVKTGDVLLLSGCQGMDPGAQIALQKLYELRPDLDEDELFGSIKNRVAVTL